MRKVSALVIALVAMLVVGGIAAHAAKKKEKVKSNVTLQFDEGPGTFPDGYYEEAVFKGTVKAKGKASKKAKKACKKRRQVTIKQVGGGTFGKAKTNAQGKYTLSASDVYNQPGRYFAQVAKKKKGKITCKSASSKKVEAF